MNYFSNKDINKRKACQLVNIINEKYSKELAAAKEHAVVLDYQDTAFRIPCQRKDTIIEFMKATTVEAIFSSKIEGKTAVLNFASYKNPGGMFFEGSMAQEESLCHSSLLYPVLRDKLTEFYEYNRHCLNKALYQDRLIYASDILFFTDGRSQEKMVDVITCAAPNWGVYSKYNGDTVNTRKKNKRVLYNRFKAILYSAVINECDTIILGAWGCGVFGQDPEIVASVMKSCLRTYKGCIKKVVFAIPDNETYKTFYDIFMSEIDM